ncbi:hypothetical protein BDB01DRAFT_792092 [Pilobolus umbonatus]|nr:hypothetical protein BDB01DRAFT_792092 [Pilobolus umbonatus]
MVKRKTTEVDNSASAATIASHAEESFPRGGASTLTPLEHREISNKAAHDLFTTAATEETVSTTEQPVKKKRKSAKKAKAVTEEKKEEKQAIGQLHYKQLTVGTSVLGCISHINELEIVVSLPNQIVGTLAITEISDPITALVEKVAAEDEDELMDGVDAPELPDLHKYFFVGQWLHCKVINVQEEAKKSSIELSVKPSIVNENISGLDLTPGVILGATVKSVEDHGYILDLGIKDLTGFLPLKKSKTYIKLYNRNEELSPGQYVECLVEKADKRTANVTVDRTKLAEAVVDTPFSSITSILPGQKVNGIIQTIQSNGLVIQMMGLYETTIYHSHIPDLSNTDKYKLGQNITFRTLFTIINADEKKIGGSLLPHILSLSAPVLNDKKKTGQFVGDIYPVGTFFDKTTITRVTPTGVWVSLENIDSIKGHVNIACLADDRVPSISATSGKYKVGSVHRARVLGYNSVDATLVMTMQPSVLEEKFLRISDIEVGAILDGTVEKLIPAGMLVRISKGMVGFVPPFHMSDAKLTRPEYKYKPGKAIQCRVLATDESRHRITLTLKKSLINSEFPIFKSIDDCKVNSVSHGVITSLRKTGCVVTYYNNLFAFAPITEMSETRVNNIEEAFKVGQTVKTTVLKINPEDNKMLVSFIGTKDRPRSSSTQELGMGKIVDAVIQSVKPTYLDLLLPGDIPGRVYTSEVYSTFDEIPSPKNPLASYKANQKIKVKVLGIPQTKLQKYTAVNIEKAKKSFVECSLRLDKNDESTREMSNLKVGEKYIGIISGVNAAFIQVFVSKLANGIIQRHLASSDIEICQDLKKNFTVGEAIQVAVISVDTVKSNIHFMNVENEETAVITDVSQVTPGQTMNALVLRKDRVTGLMVELINQLVARVYLTDIADELVEDPTAPFNKYDVVRVSILSVNYEKKAIDASMRPSRFDSTIKSNEIKSFKDVRRGKVYSGYVNNISPSGVFVKIASQIVVRVKIANLCDGFIREWKDIYKLGQLVKVKILYIDYNVERFEGTLKSSAIENTEPEKSKKTKEKKVEESDEEMEEDDEDEVMKEASECEAEEEEEDSDKEEAEEPSTEKVAALNLKGFDWTGIDNRKDSSDEESSDGSDDESDEENNNKKKKKEEVKDITAELNSTAPQTAHDFERLLVGSPDSSYLWINYMAYQLQLSEIAKARDIGERALKTINFREEQEKLNVWVALFNLENNFGTQETLEEVFKRALTYCDPLKVYLQLVKIYERSNKDDKAEATWEEIVKKFGQHPEVWVGFGTYYLEHDNTEGARSLLQRSLKVLPKQEHPHTIVKFAQLEFKHGEPERGRTILEGVMSNYPKRLDLWSIYLDMEIKAGDIETTRRLFERVASMKFSSKKMKFLFKKWIQFEKTHGSEDDIQRVKERALAYVESMS